MVTNKLFVFIINYKFNVNEKNTVLDDDITEDCARIIRTWNNTTGHYLMFDDKTDLNHELMNITSFKKNSIATNKIKAYIHISSTTDFQQL